MNDLSSLIERVERATGPDRLLDVALHAHFFPTTFLDGSADHYAAIGLLNHADLRYLAEFVPYYTKSFDAAVTFAENYSHINGRKLICFFCAGGQLMPHNTDRSDPDYHPLAKIDNSVTVGWMSHVAFYKPDGGSETYGPDGYSHATNGACAVILATLRAIALLRAFQSSHPATASGIVERESGDAQ